VHSSVGLGSGCMYATLAAADTPQPSQAKCVVLGGHWQLLFISVRAEKVET
jgi:hypothetical protein